MTWDEGSLVQGRWCAKLLVPAKQDQFPYNLKGIVPMESGIIST